MNASATTLERRAQYRGGRKSRSAMRRLRVMGFTVVPSGYKVAVVRVNRWRSLGVTKLTVTEEGPA